MVDLRGFGGSNGCLDWSGPGEQADVVNAVEWAASQPWSTGKVGMYGKSYDGLTGLIGVNQRPEGLGAVVSQEPVYDDYRYLYGDGMRRENSRDPRALRRHRRHAGPAKRRPELQRELAQQSGLPGPELGGPGRDDDHDSDFWKQRNLIPGAAGSKVPLFLTQGLTENNTVADGLRSTCRTTRATSAPGSVPGSTFAATTPTTSGRLKMGRAGWFDEVMRFYDRFLKGDQVEGQGPDDRGADERRQVAR